MMASLSANFKPFAAGARSQQQRGAAPPPPSARLGGGGYGGSSFGGSDRDRRLILPGQEAGGSSSGRLVIPGAPGGGSGAGLGGAGAPAMQQNFRPPPGFMDAAAPVEVAPEVAGMHPEEMLNRLRSFSGHWHQLAKLLPALQRAGFDGPAIEEATGLERKIQNVWGTASQARAACSTSRQGTVRRPAAAHATARTNSCSLAGVSFRRPCCLLEGSRVPYDPGSLCSVPLPQHMQPPSACAGFPRPIFVSGSAGFACPVPPAHCPDRPPSPQVYESIKAPGLLPPGALEHFDAEGEYLLYELRFLSIAQRAPAAAYIAERNLRWAAPRG